jgi:hypothetical protein
MTSIYNTGNQNSGTTANTRANNSVSRTPADAALAAVVNNASATRNSSINVTNNAVDMTVRVFDSFDPLSIDVPVAEWDVVLSFFNQVFGTGDAAKAFATNLFRVSYESNTPVLTLLDQMTQFDRIKVTQTLAYYLNGYRSLSTLLGINSSVVPSVWAARNILP